MITRISSDDVHFWDTVKLISSDGEIMSGKKYGLELYEWEQLGEVISLPKNRKFLSADDIPQHLFIIKSGLVVGYEELANGNELFYYLMDQNAMMMESNVLLRHPAGVNFRTMEPTELIRVQKETLLREMEKDQRIIFSMFCSVSNKFLISMEELRGSRGNSAEWMLCHLLLEFAEHYGVIYDGKVLIRKSISFQMLAGMLGVNRVTAVRAMHNLRDLGLVERINGFLCIRSKELLKNHQELLEN